MMTLKFSQTAKLTRPLTGRRPVHPAADDDFEIYILGHLKSIYAQIWRFFTPSPLVRILTF